jgi:hypothetical protein
MFAYVQFNDPDPVVWILIYGIVAVLLGLSNFLTLPKIVLYVVMAGLILFALFHAGYFLDWLRSEDKSELFGEMVYEKPYIEGTREFLGLLIALGGLWYLTVTSSDSG